MNRIFFYLKDQKAVFFFRKPCYHLADEMRPLHQTVLCHTLTFIPDFYGFV